MLQWFDPHRVVSVCAVGSGHHYRDPRGDEYEMEDSVTMMCRLSNGGLAHIRVDMLSDRPHNMTHYALQGTDGAYESSDGFRGVDRIWLRSRSEAPVWEALEDLEEEFLPELRKHPPEEAVRAGHGGGDYWQVQDFVTAIREGCEPPIGIDQGDGHDPAGPGEPAVDRRRLHLGRRPGLPGLEIAPHTKRKAETMNWREVIPGCTAMRTAATSTPCREARACS